VPDKLGVTKMKVQGRPLAHLLINVLAQAVTVLLGKLQKGMPTAPGVVVIGAHPPTAASSVELHVRTQTPVLLPPLRRRR